MLFHDGQVQRVSRGKPVFPKNDAFRSIDGFRIDRQDLVYDSKQGIERRLDRVAPIYGGIAVQDLVEDLRVRDQSPSF